MELRIARQLAHLTQKELADRAGVDAPTICRIETGERDLGSLAYAKVIRIARVLNPDIPVEKLFPVPFPPPRALPTRARLEKAKGLNP